MQPQRSLTLSLPVATSINRVDRRLGNKSSIVKIWRKRADAHLWVTRQKLHSITGKFVADITWHEDDFGSFDPDNRLKVLLDYLEDRLVIENDRLCRLLIVGWGHAPDGCIVTIAPWENWDENDTYIRRAS